VVSRRGSGTVRAIASAEAMEESYRVWLLCRDGVRTVDGLWIFTSEHLPKKGETITVVDASDFRRGAARARVGEVSGEKISRSSRPSSQSLSWDPLQGGDSPVSRSTISTGG
jgi:hypothetical protein